MGLSLSLKLKTHAHNYFVQFQKSVIGDIPWGKSPSPPPESDRNFPQPNRVQDKEFLEMTDSGRCLSMHQPWASHLICGIKM